MAWTAPKTWTVGEVLTAADLNEQLRDNLTWLKQAHAGAGYQRTAVNQALTNQVWNPVEWNLDLWEDSGYAGGGGTGVFVPRAGRYLAYTHLRFVNASGSGNSGVRLVVKNSGGAEITWVAETVTPLINPAVSVAGIAVVPAGGYIEAQAYVDATGAAGELSIGSYIGVQLLGGH